MLTSIAFLFILAMFGSTIAMVLRRGSGSGSSDRELQEMRERLLRLEQSMETMTGDMERVSESQRFMTALLEDRARSQGALKPPPSRGNEPGGGNPVGGPADGQA